MRKALLPVTAVAFALTACVDLSQEDAIWSRRDALKDLSVSSVRVTVRSVGATNQASAIHVSLALRPDGAPSDGGADVVVASGAQLALTAGAEVELPG